MRNLVFILLVVICSNTYAFKIHNNLNHTPIFWESWIDSWFAIKHKGYTNPSQISEYTPATISIYSYVDIFKKLDDGNKEWICRIKVKNKCGHVMIQEVNDCLVRDNDCPEDNNPSNDDSGDDNSPQD